MEYQGFLQRLIDKEIIILRGTVTDSECDVGAAIQHEAEGYQRGKARPDPLLLGRQYRHLSDRIKMVLSGELSRRQAMRSLGERSDRQEWGLLTTSGEAQAAVPERPGTLIEPSGYRMREHVA